MKVTSLKDVESYIYWSVIVPLQGLGIETDSEQPILDRLGQHVAFMISQERVQCVDAAHNYQRDLARDSRRSLVVLLCEGNEMIVADFDHRTHNVNVYMRPFIQLQMKILGNKLTQAFYADSLFKKVVVHQDGQRGYSRDVTVEELTRNA